MAKEEYSLRVINQRKHWKKGIKRLIRECDEPEGIAILESFYEEVDKLPLPKVDAWCNKKYAKRQEEKPDPRNADCHYNKKYFIKKRKQKKRKWTHEYYLEYQRRYRQENREHLRELNREWSQENKEYLSEYHKEYYKKNAEHIKKYQKEYQHEYRKNHKEELNAKRRERYKRRKENENNNRRDGE